MKPNKYIKPGIITAVVLLCAGVFAAYMLTRAPVEPQPLPIDIVDTDVSQTAPDPLPVTVDWKPSIPDKTETDTADSIEAFPKVESEDSDTVVINFTDPDKGKTTPPPAPDSESDSVTTAPATPTPTPAPTATPAPASKPAATPKTAATPTPKPKATPKPTPTPSKSEDTSGTRSDGAVYDDVFGWVIPSKGITEPAHSDGDINKMVGSMGGP